MFYKLSHFIQRQISHFQEGGLSVLPRKIRGAIFYVIENPLKLIFQYIVATVYKLAVYLKLDWATAYFYVGEKLSQRYDILSSQLNSDKSSLENIANRAIACFEKSFSLNPDNFIVLEFKRKMLSSSGKIDEASKMMHEITESQRKAIKSRQLDKLNIEFIQPDMFLGAIGKYENLDAYLKGVILGLRDAKKLISLIPQNITLNNPCIVNYWSRYVSFISDPISIKSLSLIEKYLTVPLSGTIPFRDKTMNTYSAIGEIQKQWDEENRPPLLVLSPEDSERGWQCLKSLGVPKGAWFVCLHVREPGYRDGGAASENFRNCDIKTYFTAIKTIVDAGGWVIRMGDPTSMTPLPPMKNVIDYAHSKFKSDWMDVFCCAQCRFLIATSSGVLVFSSIFGVPLVVTNCLPASGIHGFSRRDVFIPRLCWSIKENRYLSFSELISQPVGMAHSQHTYDKLGLKVVENSSEEINEIVGEMLDRLDGNLEYSKEDQCLQKQFGLMATACITQSGLNDGGINARVGASFLRKYSYLLPQQKEHKFASDYDK